MDFREWNRSVSEHGKQLNPVKKTCFSYGKYFEDVRQDEKHVPDLLEAIMRLTDPVKEELRPILFKMNQIRIKIQKNRASTFWIPQSQSFPAGGQCQPPHQ